MATNYVDPISRIEGHLGVDLTWDDASGGTGLVTEANVHGNLWRGFENFLIGREPNDAITFTQRICGVCPVPHGQAATFAVEAAMGYNDNFHTYHTSFYGDGKGIPEKAIHIRNLILSSEFLMSSITHFYHLAAPSYVQGPNTPPWTPYFNDSFYTAALQSNGSVLPEMDEGFSSATVAGATPVWSAVIKSYVHALRIRRLTFEAGALFAGRMPMTSSFIAGGVTNDAGESLTTKLEKFVALTEEVGRFVIKEYVPISLALGYLYMDYDNSFNGGSGYGAGCGNMLTWGAFPQMDDTLAISKGYMTRADVLANSAATAITVADVTTNLREHIEYSRYASASEAGNATNILDPSNEDRTIPERNVVGKYSWIKAPRWDGNPMEVGPMARMFVMGVFQENVDLKVSASSAVLQTVTGDAAFAGFDAYARTITVNGVSATGLDPSMIAPDVAVALVRANLAMLAIDNGTGVFVGATANTNTTATYEIENLDEATILSAYTDGLGDAIIVGPAMGADGLVGYIYNMKAGLSTMDRLRGRSIESLYLVQKMLGGYSKAADTFAGGWCAALDAATGATFVNLAYPVGETFGFGGHEAARGALMHMCTQEAGKITAYQCIVPTTWNGSPKDVGGVRGPMEEAMIDVPYSTDLSTYTDQNDTPQTTESGVEALRVAQSFDPCIACAVH